MGDGYSEGDGVGKNMREAFASYVKAAERGSPGAMVEVGVCYQICYGTIVNLSQVAKYFQKASELGDALGLTVYASCVMNGQG